MIYIIDLEMRDDRLSEKFKHKVRMQTYNMDHTRKACVTALPNFVTEAQKYEKSRDFGGKRESHVECYFAKKLFTCHWIFFVKILKRKHEKGLRLIWATVHICYLPAGRSV